MVTKGLVEGPDDLLQMTAILNFHPFSLSDRQSIPETDHALDAFSDPLIPTTSLSDAELSALT